jgi:cystathionine beta-lyase/cystathionine gamma-synthase
MDSLAALTPVFREGGSVTAGNASGKFMRRIVGKGQVNHRTSPAHSRVRARVSGWQPVREFKYVETISNPLLRVADLDALADLARRADAGLLVDNTFATPVLCRPLERGAALVQESLTKFIGGHSDLTLGYVGGADAGDAKPVAAAASTWGLTAGPFDCWLALRSLETLALRVRASSTNAAELAERIVHWPGITRVIYPGRPDHPDHALVKKLLPDSQGAMLAFELAGGRAAAETFLRKTGVPLCPSLGHSGTTISYPAATSHRGMTPDERARRGVTDGLLRLSVGVEPVNEVAKELERGLERR